ncbi:acyl carrier protein [Kitasatospora sp. NBC_00085]|uniref:acyl carrier protein n=1 Tax=unclassified Kitasatospora TaxID=2633591 RepID=UPI003246C460
MATTTEHGPVVADIIGIFADILDADGEISPDSDFFESGGNSVLAGVLVAKLQKAFQAKVTIREVFAASTPAQLADVVVARAAAPR